LPFVDATVAFAVSSKTGSMLGRKKRRSIIIWMT
jgi:hypothetical protein